MTHATPLIQIKDIQKEYDLGATKVYALRSINLTVNKGDFLSIVGPSGSGKSTLLNMIGCLDTPNAGSITFDGVELTTLKEKEATLLRRHEIGFIFQTFNLIPVLTAYENIEVPLLLLNIEPKEREEKVMGLMRKIGIEAYKDHYPNELSGGQRQRVSIARAVICEPKLVLADEPTANLDHETGMTVLKLMRQMNEELNTTFIFSTHDPKVVEMAKQRVVLEDGKIKA